MVFAVSASEPANLGLTAKYTTRTLLPYSGHPVALVWGTCDAMEGAKRKDVVEACVVLGVNVHTARTQYQVSAMGQDGRALHAPRWY